MKLYITNIDYESKTVTLDNNPPPGYTSGTDVRVGDTLTLDGTILRRGATFCMDYPDGPVYCPWPRE